MTNKMVLVQRTNATLLPNMEPEDFGDSEGDYNAMASAITRMNEREHSYILKQMNGRASPSKGELTPRSVGTPKTQRGQFLGTPRTPRSNTFIGINSTVLNDNVPFTPRNSAITSYASPRQFVLSASHMSREGSGLPPRLQSLSGMHRNSPFDYDENEGTFRNLTIIYFSFFVLPRGIIQRYKMYM